MKELGKKAIAFLVECLQSGKQIPEEYKHALFPTKQKEYELAYAGKMRKEDVLADKEEAKPVPLQVEKVFNGKKHPARRSWQNLLVFGDNLQILKTFNENKDPLIKNKVKGKVKLIYIDPPFATKDEFQNKDGAKAYSDKVKGAEFVEFLRKRLILAREILADDGSIYVHLDSKMSHYIKIILDEIFGKENFMNEIAWKKLTAAKSQANYFSNVKDTVFLYRKYKDVVFHPIYITSENDDVNYPHVEERTGRKYGSFDFSQSGEGPPRVFGDKTLHPPAGKHWIWSQSKIDQGLKEGRIIFTRNGRPRVKRYLDEKQGNYLGDLWVDDEVAPLSANSSERSNYPTQKPEKLLERIIRASSNEGDLVMDFFCGSGTSLAVAEKLNRRWIGCDIGKLAMYTTQKRLLEIEQSKGLNNSEKRYCKPAKSFAVVTSGLYDLGKVFKLQKDEYVRFVEELFEIEPMQHKIGGVQVDGKKRGYYAKIFQYWEHQDASVDDDYLQELHRSIGKKISERFYIIAPATSVDFFSDYEEVGGVRYYFLKVPYQMIKELHKVQFKKLRQPQSKAQLNNLDEAIGFHFIRPPEVKSELKQLKNKIVLKIKKFESAYSKDELDKKLNNFESLAMLLVDSNYNGEQFMLSDCFFAQDLVGSKSSDDDSQESGIKAQLTKQQEIKKEFPKCDCGSKIMVVYVDIYGNEFREVFNTK